MRNLLQLIYKSKELCFPVHPDDTLQSAAAYLRGLFWAMLCLIAVACTQGAPPNSGFQTSTIQQRADSTRNDSASHDLTADEREGGHVLQRHVGRTDAQLHERLDRERHIAAASTYTDRATAELAVGEAIQQNQGRIQRWLDRTGGHPNLVLDYQAERPIGRVMNRGESVSSPCSSAVVVLKWAGPGHYYVLTSYPECR